MFVFKQIKLLLPNKYCGTRVYSYPSPIIKFIYTISCVLILSLFSDFALSQGIDYVPKCGITINNNEDTELLDSSYFEWINNNQHTNRRKGQVITLPVVVHVIHNNGPENISDDDILKGIDNLNDAFRNRGYFDPLIGEDTEIEFCLSQRDPFNNETSGIVRYESILTDMSLPQSGIKNVADLATFNPREYINIRIVSNPCIGNNCDVAGFGLRPFSFSDITNGIYIDYKYFGDMPKYSSILVHEMGHFLSLHHTFAGGCRNDNCLLDGDKVCDTPPDGTNNQVFCGFTINSCHTDSDDSSIQNPYRSISLGGLGDVNDDEVNYMDYSQPRCKKRFTTGQKNRMHWFINSQLQAFLTSKACSPPCPENIVANFSIDTSEVQVGEELIFTNNSEGGANYYWYVNGVLDFQGQDYFFQSDIAGVFEIELVVESLNEDCNNKSYKTNINVRCPEFPSLEYHQVGDFLIFYPRDTDLDYIIKWTITDINGDTLKISNALKDSIDVAQIDYLDICLDLSYFECQFRNCTVLNYQSGNEICGNELDDDGDGLIDYFDPDCNCDEKPEKINCDLLCQKYPDSFPDIKMKLKWMSEEIGKTNTCSFVVGDINNDDIIDIVLKKYFGNKHYFKENSNSIVTLNGNTGVISNELNYTDTLQFAETTAPLIIADTDRDSYAEIFFADRDTIYKYNHKLELQWKILKPKENIRLGICDFNQDGIAELYLSNIIINSTNGVILAQDTIRRGCNYIFRDPSKFDPDTICDISQSIAADLLPSPGLELAAGDIVYEVQISNTNGTAGNTLIPHYPSNSIIRDGITSVGDIDGDGELDVILVRSVNYSKMEGGIFVWNPRTGALIAKGPAGEDGGVAFVGDLNNDCVPEIGVVFEDELVVYQYNNTQNLDLLYSIQIADVPGRTTMTSFDFNKDGIMELLHRDEEYFRIIHGPSGITMDSIPIISATFMESPIVADVDNDGQAEILFTGRLTEDSQARLFCYETAAQPWAPARDIWNQYAYHVTNINDDLTVPRSPQNQAIFIPEVEDCLQTTCPQPYNNMFVQSTTRSQNGCVQFGVNDLTISALDYSCIGDSLTIKLFIVNLAETSVTNTCISSGSYTNSQLIGNSQFTNLCFERDTTSERLKLSDTISVTVLKPTNSQYLFFTINDKGTGINEANYVETGILECDYTNNIDSLFINVFDSELDLGPDITKCESEVFSINAGTGYFSYLWSDLSTDSIFSSNLGGLHYLEAIDECGLAHFDTILINIDTTLNIDLGENMVICPNQMEIINLGNKYDKVIWSPLNLISCDTCSQISILSDTSFQLSIFVQEGNCISFDTINIEVMPFVYTMDEVTVCNGESFLHQDSILSVSGQYEFLLNGCDSIHRIDLDILPLDTFSFSRSICTQDSILFNGAWLKVEGIYSDTLANAEGCDSITTLDLSLIILLRESDTISLCVGDTFRIWDEIIEIDTSLSKLFIANNGCDSLQEYKFVFNPKPNIVDTFYFCQGDSILFDNTAYYDSESIINTYPSALNCDSTYTAQLIMLPYITAFDTMQICQGDSILINGNWVTEPTTILDTLISGNCSVVKETLVQENAIDLLDRLITICPNDSVYIDGNWIKANSTVEEKLRNQFGCDSIIMHEVRIISDPPPTNVDFDCESLIFEITFNVNTPWKFISLNSMDTIESIIYSSDTSFSFNLFSLPDCDQKLDLSFPQIPLIEDITEFNDTLVAVNKSINIALDLDPDLWNATWFPTDKIDCDTCFNVNITSESQVEISIEFEHIPTGCIYFRSFEIDILEPDTQVYPNIFSPNDDGQNDFWEIDLLNAVNPTTHIFDRWGNLMFKSTNSIVKWDGKFNNRGVSPGVYIYHLRYSTSEGLKKSVYGDITLMR